MDTMQGRSTGEDLRAVMRNWVTGISVITSYDPHRAPIGVVSNSFTSVSLDPPLVSWAIARSSSSIDAWLACESYSVHILAADRTDLVTRFSRSGSDKFAGVETVDSVVDTPVIEAIEVRLDCRVWDRYDAGDHVLLIGEVLNHQAREQPQDSLTSLVLY